MNILARCFLPAVLVAGAASGAIASPPPPAAPPTTRHERLVDAFFRFCTPPAPADELRERVLALDPKPVDRTRREEGDLHSNRLLVRMEGREAFAIFDDTNCGLMFRDEKLDDMLGAFDAALARLGPTRPSSVASMLPDAVRNVELTRIPWQGATSRFEAATMPIGNGKQALVLFHGYDVQFPVIPEGVMVDIAPESLPGADRAPRLDGKAQFAVSTPAQDCAEGPVAVRVDVAADGRVERVTIPESYGNRQLEAAAVAHANQWRFTPGIRAGKPAGGTLDLVVVFRSGCADGK